MASKYVYHTTFLRNAVRISQEGLTPSTGSQFAPAYSSHSRGRIFFSNAEGVPFWMGKLESVAHHNSDFDSEEDLGWTPVVLRTQVKGLKLEPDPEGYRDSRESAWFTTQRVSQMNLEIWTGSKWSKLYESTLETMFEEVLESATWQEEGYSGWWEIDFELFAPF